MPTKVEFTARLQNGAVVWDAPDGNPAKGHKLHLKKGDPPETIEFTLKDKTGMQLRFSPGDPIHVWEQEGCPPPGIATDQIQVSAVTPDKIQVTNLNTGPARTLQYQLNAVDQSGNECPCDPIIINDGGGPGFI